MILPFADCSEQADPAPVSLTLIISSHASQYNARPLRILKTFSLRSIRRIQSAIFSQCPVNFFTISPEISPGGACRTDESLVSFSSGNPHTVPVGGQQIPQCSGSQFAGHGNIRALPVSKKQGRNQNGRTIKATGTILDGPGRGLFHGKSGGARR